MNAIHSLKTFILLVLLTIVAIGCSNGTSSEASGENYPEKNIEVVVPAGAGGDTDRNTRITAEYLEEELGTKVVVSNVAGAGGTTGAEQVLDAPADGYKVLSFHNSLILNDVLGLADFNYEDFKMAGTSIADLSNTFIVNANSEIKDLESLIKVAKENPGEVSIATETGGFTHLQLLAFQKETGTELNIVDVGGASDKTTALLGGKIDIIPTSLGLVEEYIESGDFRSIGVMSEERLEGAPDVPTFKEQGVDISFDKFFFWAFPEETPQEIVDKFSGAMENIVNNSDYQEEISSYLVEADYKDGEETNEHFSNLTEQYEALYEESQ